MEKLKSELVDLIKDADEKLMRVMIAMAKEYNKASVSPDQEQLYRLVYTSARHPTCTDEEIDKILEISRKNNAQLGITGILIHTKDRFLQVLEGEKSKVTRLYEKIEKDDRHGGSAMRYCEPVNQRHFSDWEMAGKAIDENKVKFHTDPTDQKYQLYKSMLDGDLTSYKDEGMRVLKTFLLVS